MYGPGENGQFDTTGMPKIVRRGPQDTNKVDFWAAGTGPANGML